MLRITSYTLATMLVALCPGAGISAEATPKPSPVDGGTEMAVPAQYGNVEALLRLGDLYSDATSAGRDPAKAFSYYRMAAAAGSAAGKLRVGEMQALGEGTTRDSAAGLAAIEEAAASGEAAALALLGNLYSRPDNGVVTPDMPRAFEYYRRAAEAGNDTGILRSGEMLARGQGTAQDTDAGRAIVRRLAERGNGYALVALGDLLSSGDAGAIDGPAAQTAYAKAVTLGRTEALVRLGDFFSSGRAVPPDLAKAFDYYRQATEAGDETGNLRLSEAIFRGRGTAKDIQAGLSAIKAVAAGGNADALALLGDIYSAPASAAVARNPAAALDYYQRAASAGSVAADLRAGEMIAHGDGTVRDVQKGRAMVRRIADMGNPAALISLGDLLREPESRAVDGAGALGAYARAADLGDPDALMRLGDFYSDGMTIAVDLPKALEYYRQATRLGSTAGLVRIGAMTARGQGTPQDVAAGRGMVQMAIDTGDAAAFVVMGDLLSRGDGGPVDLAAAVRAYSEAAALGSTQALLRLGDLYRDGKITQTSGPQAAGYYRKAAEAGDVYGLYSLGSALTEGLLRSAGTAADGVQILRDAQSRGLAEAVIPLADGQLYGNGVRRDAKAAVAMLEQAANEGNLRAARHLLSYYRDGRRDRRSTVLRPDPKRAEALFAAIAPQLSRGDRLFEELLLRVSTSDPKAYQAALGRLHELAPEDRQMLIRTLRTAEENAYVYLAQVRLKEAGFYAGPITGLLGGTTTRAINLYCTSISMSKTCRFGPMSSQAADLLSYAF